MGSLTKNSRFSTSSNSLGTACHMGMFCSIRSCQGLHTASLSITAILNSVGSVVIVADPSSGICSYYRQLNSCQVPNGSKSMLVKTGSQMAQIERLEFSQHMLEEGLYWLTETGLLELIHYVQPAQPTLTVQPRRPRNALVKGAPESIKVLVPTVLCTPEMLVRDNYSRIGHPHFNGNNGIPVWQQCGGST